jgi:hypothetical protein
VAGSHAFYGADPDSVATLIERAAEDALVAA